MASAQYTVEECGRKQKLRGPGGQGQTCEYCGNTFTSKNDFKRHRQNDLRCKLMKRSFRKKVRKRVKEMSGTEDDSGISMEVEKVGPLKIRINLAKKWVLSISEELVEPKKKYIAAQSANPETQMVQIKKEVLAKMEVDLTSVKTEPGTSSKAISPGIRLSVEKTNGSNFSVALVSDIPQPQTKSVDGKASHDDGETTTGSEERPWRSEQAIRKAIHNSEQKARKLSNPNTFNLSLSKSVTSGRHQSTYLPGKKRNYEKHSSSRSDKFIKSTVCYKAYRPGPATNQKNLCEQQW